VLYSITNALTCFFHEISQARGEGGGGDSGVNMIGMAIRKMKKKTLQKNLGLETFYSKKYFYAKL